MSSNSVILSNVPGKLSSVLAIIWTVFTLAYISHFLAHLGIILYSLTFRSISSAILCILVFLLVPPRKGMRTDVFRWYDLIAILWIVVGCGYVAIRAETLIMTWGDATPTEMLLGIPLILCFLEATRRTINIFLPVIVIAFFFYMVYSDFFPGVFRSSGYSFSFAIGWMYLSGEGLWGMIIGIVTTLLAGFILFGAALHGIGTGKFYTDLAISLFGSLRGGVAKTAIITSGLMGSVSGSVAANVATTGIVTIPLMKKTGYSPEYAGAVESCASTGGMILPPVMGATAFLIAEFLEVSYWQVCVSAFLPALLYYLSLFVHVDLQAAKRGIKGIPKKDLPSFKETLAKGWLNLFPMVLLIFFLGYKQYSAETSVLYALLGLVIVSFVKKETRLTPKRVVSIMEDTAKTMTTIGPLCVIVGIILGATTITGVGINLSGQLLDISGGNVFLILLFAAIASMVLGLGMPAITCYILTVILMAPALIRVGINPMAAHLFLFYFGVVSYITPPVCIAAYIASSISKGNPWKTGIKALGIGLGAFILPWAFVFNPGLLMFGSIANILLTFSLILIGAVIISTAINGFFIRFLSYPERIMLAAVGLTLFAPLSYLIKVIALGIGALLFMAIMFTGFTRRRT